MHIKLICYNSIIPLIKNKNKKPGRESFQWIPCLQDDVGPWILFVLLLPTGLIFPSEFKALHPYTFVDPSPSMPIVMKEREVGSTSLILFLDLS